MSAEEAAEFYEELREESPATAQVALGAAANAFKLRIQYLTQQPRKKQADWIRRALSRPRSASIAEEVLASYFLEVQEDLVKELLDLLGIAHEDGQLEDANPPAPPPDKLEAAVETFRAGEESGLRELLLRAFAAQSAIDWPELDKLLDS